MSHYLDVVWSSSLPLRWEAVAAILVFLYLANQALYRKALSTAQAQSFVVGDYVTDEEKRWGWTLPLGQFVYAAAIFLFGIYAGGALFTLLVGGLLVSALFTAAHNVRSILYYRSLALPDAVRGNLSISKLTLLRHRTHFCLQAALFSLSAGLLLGHLALIGGALILGFTGYGYVRRRRSAEAHL